jgi:cytidylate kinase
LIITLSRQVGSWGDQIAQRVSNLLNYSYFTQRMLILTAEKMGISEKDFYDLTEDSYKYRSFIDRLLGRKESKVIRYDFGPLVKTLDDESSTKTLISILKEIAKRDNIVIVGRGGQAIFKDTKGVIHVKIVAPFEVRVKRIMKRLPYTKDEAEAFVRKKDRTTAQYVKRFYDVDWNNSALYDLWINTKKIGVEQAAASIVSFVKSRES